MVSQESIVTANKIKAKQESNAQSQAKPSRRQSGRKYSEDASSGDAGSNNKFRDKFPAFLKMLSLNKWP